MCFRMQMPSLSVVVGGGKVSSLRYGSGTDRYVGSVRVRTVTERKT